MVDVPTERRWFRFALKIAALWATLLGAVGYAASGELAVLWWGLRLTGALTICTGALGLYRHHRGERRGRRPETVFGWTPSRALTGGVRVLLGSAVVVATL